ncbi:MAG TPA: hypothetical protein DDY22_14230 [Geobacter sp.]|nr:hypothetical protein [Geobacter sp.]
MRKYNQANFRVPATCSGTPAARTDAHVLDAAMPLRIHGKSWGTLRIGISMLPLEREPYL